VLDPFVGGGTSLVEAAKCGASVVGIDIDPVACFVTTKELQAFDEDILCRAFASVERAVKNKLLEWYQTTLADGRAGTVIYAFWVDRIKCPECRNVFDGHPHFQLRRFRKANRQTVFCSQCGEIANLALTRKRFTCKACHCETKILAGTVAQGVFRCPECETQTPLRTLSGGNRPLKQRLFALEVLVDGTKDRVFKAADKRDLAVYRKVALLWRQRKRNRFVPRDFIPVRDRHDSRPVSHGYRRYKDLFNPRQLLCLATLADAISRVRDDNARELLALAFSDCLAANNMFCYYAFDYGKLTPLFGLHAYAKVSRPVENNVWGTEVGRGSFSKCFYKMLDGKRYAANPYEYVYDGNGQPTRVLTGESVSCDLYRRGFPATTTSSSRALILNRSSEDLRPIATNSVDLILSDPPYYDNLAYSELSDFFHVWLKLLKLKRYLGNEHKRSPLKESLYVAGGTAETNGEHAIFSEGLASAFSECCRVLKNDGLLVFTFHHNDPRAWAALAAALLGAGFRITNTFPVRSEGQSQFHSEEGNLKWDEVIVCRKQFSKLKQEPLDDWTNLQERLDLAAEEEVRNWSKFLRKNKLEFTAKDARSLKSALILMHLSSLPERPSDLIEFFKKNYQIAAQVSQSKSR
jgi:adenine-specific DNA methylase